jgi:hypothetical protein
MTFFTVAASRPGQDAAAEPRPAWWRGMVWVTWRQHRGLLGSVAVVLAVAVAGLVATGLRIHHDYALLTGCRPAASAACQGLSRFFDSTDFRQAQLVHVAVQAAPVLVALFAGPPALARDLENRTYRFAWTQGIGRMRWTVAKLTLLGLAITVPSIVVGQLFSWMFAPFLTTRQITAVSPQAFGTGALAYPAWALTAFCLGAFLGMLIRRFLPAMAVTLFAYAGLAALTWFSLRDRYPVSTFWPMQLFEAAWLLALSAALIAGTIWLAARLAD